MQSSQTELMLKATRKPNFFPGQWVDYNDFNRLAAYPGSLLAELNRNLYSGGGIVLGASEELRVAPLDGLSVIIKPGIALLPSGNALVLSEKLVLDITPYVTGSDPTLLVVGIRQKSVGCDKFTDASDSSIYGFKSESSKPEVFVAVHKNDTDRNSADSLELFRVRIAKANTKLRKASIEEEWDTLLESSDPQVAVIDTRYRRIILPHTLAPSDTLELLTTRKAIYAIESALRKIATIYLVEDAFYTCVYLAELHSEMLSRPIQPLKIAFAISEFAEKLAFYLESVKRKLADRTHYDKDTLLRIIELLGVCRSKAVLPQGFNLKWVHELAELLAGFVKEAEKRFCMVDMVSEALSDIKDCDFPMEDKIILAGHAFQKVDAISVEDRTNGQSSGNGDGKSRVLVSAPAAITRTLSTKYANGDALSLKGIFVKDGSITVTLKVPSPESPLVVVLRQYVRRVPSILKYELNGKTIEINEAKTTQPNCWVNSGLSVPAEMLVPNDNTLKITIEKADLDYGFFGLYLYQPVITKRTEEV